jgi:hypothetical protein
MKLSYAITVCNEFLEIQKLLALLLKNKRAQDEIVVLYDSNNGDPEIEAFLRSFVNPGSFNWHKGSFKGHFADWKNHLTSLCTGDYIFQIDADELPSEDLMNDLPTIIEHNPGIDVLLVPRENYVTGLTEDHIKQWGWRLDEKDRANWPDLQWRVYRKCKEVKWINKVHEKLDGYQVYTHLPIEPRYSLQHAKTIKKQEKQNKYYDTL